MKALLVQPSPSEHPNTQPPLGLAYVGAMLRQRRWQVSILDAHAPRARYRPADLIAIARQMRPDFIGLYMMTYFVRRVYQLIAQLRTLRIPIIAGGPHATLLPQEALEHGVDIIVRGEGDLTVGELAEHFEDGRQLRDIAGLSYRDAGGATHHNPDRPLVQDLDALPFPAREQFRLDDYWAGEADGPPYGNLLASRGCPGGCTYCSAHAVFGRSYRFRSPDNVLREIKALHRQYGITHFDFRDDALTGRPPFIRALCERMRLDLGFPIRWTAITRPDKVHRELLREMRAAGCTSVTFGVESGLPNTLRRVHKGFSLECSEQAVRHASEAGLHCEVNFMWGFPWERHEDIRRSLDVVRRFRPYADVSPAGILVPFPGTRIYEQYKDEFGFADWWLRDEGFNARYRRGRAIPLYQRIHFDDHGQLLTPHSSFFRYGRRTRRTLRRVAAEIGNWRLDGLVGRHVGRTGRRPALARYALRLASRLSRWLYRLSPRLEHVLLNGALRAAARPSRQRRAPIVHAPHTQKPASIAQGSMT